MQVTVFLDHRFRITPDELVWTDGQFSRTFFDRYLDVFDRVRIVARAKREAWARPEWKRVDGGPVHFEPLPHFVGPTEYLRVRRSYLRAVEAALAGSGAYLLRTPGHGAAAAYRALRAHQRPFGAEVVGDPREAFAPGANPHPLRPLFRWLFTRQMRQHCAAAVGVSYVTKDALQQRYPAREGAFTTHYSSVELPADALVSRPRTPPAGPPRLIHVGSLEQPYKATDILLRALAQLRAAGHEWPLTVVGDGRMRPGLEALSDQLGLSRQVTFTGQLCGREAVFAALDAADLFVLASRTEGLPRATIEAMARGLPCIGSTVGGIPELLEPGALAPPDNVEALADRILALGSDSDLMYAQSLRNLAAAAEYTEPVLRARRNEFYRQLKAASPAAA